MLRHDIEFITKEFDLEDILSIKSIYENYANEMLTETEFKPQPQILCRFCDYLDICNEGRQFAEKQYKTGQTKW
jgi:hypothetical protein